MQNKLAADLKAILEELVKLKRRGFHGKLEINAIAGKFDLKIKTTEIIKAEIRPTN